MPQIQLPIFAAGSKEINSELAFECRENHVTCFNGHLPVFTHAADDLATFRFFTTQPIVNGSATQSEIVKAFGVPLTTVKLPTVSKHFVDTIKMIACRVQTACAGLAGEKHPLSNHAHNAVLKHLCAQLTETETSYPRTNLRLVFEFLGQPNSTGSGGLRLFSFVVPGPNRWRC